MMMDRRQYTDGVDLAQQAPKQSRRLKPVRRAWYKRKLIWISVGLLVIIAGLGVLYMTHRPPALPAAVKGQVKFTAFLPEKVPEGYAIDPSSYTYEGNVLLFKIKTPSGTTLLASEQPQPTNFDINDFYKGLKNTQSTTTPYGTAQAGTFLKNKAGSMTALGTWVFVSGAPQTDINQILTIFSSLKKTD